MQTMKGQAKRRWERKQQQMDAMFLMENRMPKLESRYQRATVGELMVKQKRCTATKSEVLKADLVNSAATQWWKKYASWLSEERGKHSVSARKSHMKHRVVGKWTAFGIFLVHSKWKHTHINMEKIIFVLSLFFSQSIHLNYTLPSFPSSQFSWHPFSPRFTLPLFSFRKEQPS